MIEADVAQTKGGFEGMQMYLALAPWRSRKEMSAYEKSVKAGEIPPRRPKGIKTSAQFMVKMIGQFDGPDRQNPKKTAMRKSRKTRKERKS